MKTLRILSLPVILLIAYTITYADNTASNKQALLDDARRFCASFSPAVWQEMKQHHQGAKLMDEFLRRVDEAVQTPEFESIMEKQHLVEKDAHVMYQYYVREVSRLTGKSFSCPDLKNYFEQTLQ